MVRAFFHKLIESFCPALPASLNLSVLSFLFYGCDKKKKETSLTKATGEKKLCVSSQLYKTGIQSWNLEVGTEGETWQSAACCLVPHGLLILFLYSTQDYKPRDGAAHSELGLPTSLINQENAPQENSSIMTLVCGKLI